MDDDFSRFGLAVNRLSQENSSACPPDHRACISRHAGMRRLVLPEQSVGRNARGNLHSYRYSDIRNREPRRDFDRDCAMSRMKETLSSAHLFWELCYRLK